ncbi:peptide-binding protein [Streptomyces sp. NA04227]|uniref:ABC transporter substrate-binding protein n=1 Tax=Streptomyces sp. NA04227 TaxID=2742136 RepID=UPI001591B505|nr:ABC transporter substrate-binding protein [Streptomyces sp. NA04227]QKW05638.1 peptide-binding protein [Streptomyces sp. NA04227]
MNRKTLVLSAVVGLLASGLAACGGSGGGDSDDAIVVGTTDRFAISKDAPAPFDPAFAYDSATWNVLRQTVQTLMAMPRGDGEPKPEAAKSCEFTDTGNERYVCTLRSGLQFSDGSPVTAQDVKYSIDRVRSIKSETGPLALLSSIDTVETQGKDKVIFHLNTADATFPHKLATPAAAIVQPSRYPKNRLRPGFDISGSGPYTLKPEVKDGALVKAVLTRNPRYKGRLTPKNEKVELRSFPTAERMGSALKSGDIDMMTRTMSPEQIRDLSVATRDINLVELPGLEIRYLAFDTDAPAVRDTAVRQAMAQLVDRGELASKVYGSTAEPLYSLVPASITGHSNAFFNRYGRPSQDKARQTLRAAGIDTPVRLTLHYTTDHYGPAMKKEFEVLRDQLNADGLFDVKIKGTPWSKYRPRQLDGEYAVYGMGWFPDFPDADNFLAPFLDEDNFLGTPYANPEIREELIPASRREPDRIGATGSLERIQDIVARDVPVLPLWQGKQYAAARDDIQGVEWALNSSSVLQLWELNRGVSD